MVEEVASWRGAMVVVVVVPSCWLPSNGLLFDGSQPGSAQWRLLPYHVEGLPS